MSDENSPLILASQSPRRVEILQEMGIRFEQVSSETEELRRDPGGPEGLVRANARLKAESVALRYPGRWVLGADTMVVLDGALLGKPSDRNEAVQMLRRLSGKTHRVLTGLALVCRGDPRSPILREAESRVTFRELTNEQIEDYLNRVDTLDKAGAYGIQEEGDRLVAQLEGSYSNVVGLPKELLPPMLEEIGLSIGGKT